MGSLLEQEDNEKRHYLHLFYSGFVEQVPVVHAPSFSPEGKPPFLINAMQACGAIFVKSKTAAAFIATTLKSSRKVLSEELSRDLLTIEEQLNLILTVVLLHTLGMYHEDAEERAASSLYHGMLITMIRGADFISHVATWSADEDNHLSLEEHWRHWAWHEMSKRTLLLSYLQDASQSIYFTVPSSYHIAELNFSLPCDDKLWRAQSASEWWSELHRGSPYGDAHDRLNCPTLPSLLQLVFEPRTTQVKAISHFAHWAVIHGIISCLFTLCTKGHLPVQRSFGANGDPLNQELYRIQFAMHNWLDWWMKRPEVIENTREEAELPFMQNLPGHAIWNGASAKHRLDENLWTLEPYQKNSGRVEAFYQHISYAAQLALQDKRAVVVFSGGQTRQQTTTTEAESYHRLAMQANLLPPDFMRATTENYALDSYQNLLFSIARFHEYTGVYPAKITVIGYEMKRKRFIDLHREAVLIIRKMSSLKKER
ncbi:c6 transcription factor [Lentinula edodes]|uniref:C6 transcription factor n=1 Tax=Lentinula edodes TaxID=5353 RepID=A0A1Q3EE98_LENED|nr:c6 transcription factor [Lentinula edodes]